PASASGAASARTPTERRLDTLVCGVLDRSSIDLDRSFLEQGGDSIATVRLAIAIGGAFGCRLPVGAVFEADSLRSLAARIDEVVAAPPAAMRGAIVHLRSGDARPPIWMPGPVHGNALCYMRFAGMLGRDVVLHGLQTPG